ncbi:MAG: trimeric intracellular cation channel family protein [Brachymonas sp.]|nr:trimeric intracellular cation channel family protein [Brachymonas sp.]
MPLPFDSRTVFFTLEVLGTFAFALSGLFAARAHRLDAVGTFIAAFLAAFGGGTLRDVLLYQRPFYWVANTSLLWGVLVMALLASLLLRISSRWLSGGVFLVVDAIGLGVFSATGTQIAQQQGWPMLPCVLMGVITATFGGLLRDMVCNEKPILITDPSPYASIAFVGNWLLLALLHLQWLDAFWATASTAALITLARVVLAWWGVKLPQLDDGGGEAEKTS